MKIIARTQAIFICMAIFFTVNLNLVYRFKVRVS